MSMSVELGRAVLSNPAVNLELWLNTLITVSPQQQRTNFEQHNAASLLDLLSSGKVWVDRGHGLYIDLNITSQGQPFADGQLRKLSEAILCAPAWKQLGLKPSLAQDVFQASGKLRIKVAYAVEDEAPTERQCQRFLPGNSAMNVRPPEGVNLWHLDAVSLNADTYKLHEPRKTTTSKRLKISAGNCSDFQHLKVDDGVEHNTSNLSPQDAPDATSLAPLPTLKRAQTSTLFDHENERSQTEMGFDNDSLEKLIDGAFRISVLCRINGKMLPGVKVKANTFGLGLADVAPTLWRPGYRSLLLQRANLIPVIGRSLCQVATTTDGIPSPLVQKLSMITESLSSGVHMERVQRCERSTDVDTGNLASGVASQLWLHLQRNATSKSANIVQSFVSTGSPNSIGSQTDEILEELWRENKIDCRSGLYVADPTRGIIVDQHQTLEECPAMTVSYDRDSPAQFSQKARSSSSPKDTGEELLLGDGVIEPRGLATRYENQDS